MNGELLQVFANGKVGRCNGGILGLGKYFVSRGGSERQTDTFASVKLGRWYAADDTLVETSWGHKLFHRAIGRVASSIDRQAARRCTQNGWTRVVEERDF